jgi:hypothetical protein
MTPLNISIGQSARNATPVMRQVTWEQFADSFTNALRLGELTMAEYLSAGKKGKAADKDGRWFVLGTFDGQRRAENWKSACAIVLDHDAGTLTEEQIRTSLAGHAAVASTTHSHTPDKPKWRIILPLAEPIADREQYGCTVQAAERLFPGGTKFDARSRLPEQLWFAPSCPKDMQGEHKAFRMDGGAFPPAAKPVHVDKEPEQSTEQTAESRCARVRYLLGYITLEAAMAQFGISSREAWVKIGQAAKHYEPTAKDAFVEWSEKQPGFIDEADCLQQWASFDKSKTEKPATIRTLAYLARLAGATDDADDRAELEWVEDQIHVIRPKVEQLIQADDEPGKVLQRGGELVTVAYTEQAGVVQEEGKAPLLVPLAVPYTFSTIRERVSASVQIYKTLMNEKQKGQRRGLACPELLARLLIEAQPKSAPVLNAILDTPLVRADGALLGHEGYDPVTRTYGAFRGRDFLPVPERPTRAQAAAAYKTLTEEGFADALFARPEDAAVMVAAVLTMIQRPLLLEAPAFYTSAPAGGTGKTECNRIAGYIGTGQRLGVTDWPGGQDSEYQANTLLHDLARQGARVVLFDNVGDGVRIKSAALEAAITGGTLSRRTVGHAEVVGHLFAGTILMNGNNLQFDTEGVRRRFLHCALLSNLERPAERPFSRKDLSGWLQANRMRMVQAALTMLRAARAARVEPSCSLGFPDWARYVVAALEYAGAPSIERKLVRDSVANEADNALRALLCSWHAAFGKYPRRLAEALTWTGEKPMETDERVGPLREAVAAFMEERFERVTPVNLSRKLRGVRDRLAGGFRLTSEPDRNGVERWKVQAVELAAVRTGTRGLEDLL